MRLRLTYLFRNLTRNPLRALLTCAAVALPITIFVLSMAVVSGINGYLNNSARQLRLAVTHKTSIINRLPEGHRAKIEALDPTRERLLSVCGMSWIGGQIEGVQMVLSTIAADADTFLQTFPEFNLTEEEKEAWLRDRQALIVGRMTVRQLGWKVGQRVNIKASLPPYSDMEFHIISTAENATDPNTMWCHRAYLEEEIREAGAPEGEVGFFFIKCGSKEDLDHFRQAIDARFAGSQDETRTQDEKAFMSEFVNQQFNLPRNLTILSAVTVFVAIMAATNTMSMNFRDRINEIATLKSLGFSSGFAFSLIQSESLLLCGIGGLLGAAGPYIAFTHTPIGEIPIPIIQQLIIAPKVCLMAMGIALVIGVIAAIWPAVLAMRMHVVSALRNLE